MGPSGEKFGENQEKFGGNQEKYVKNLEQFGENGKIGDNWREIRKNTGKIRGELGEKLWRIGKNLGKFRGGEFFKGENLGGAAVLSAFYVLMLQIFVQLGCRVKLGNCKLEKYLTLAYESVAEIVVCLQDFFRFLFDSFSLISIIEKKKTCENHNF